MRGVGVSWINRGEHGAKWVRVVVGFIGDEDWLIGLIIIFCFWKASGYFDFTHE